MCIVGNSFSLLRCLPGPTLIVTLWSQGPVGSPGGTMVAHWVNTCTFIVPHMDLRSMLDINGSAGAGEFKLRSAVLYWWWVIGRYTERYAWVRMIALCNFQFTMAFHTYQLVHKFWYDQLYYMFYYINWVDKDKRLCSCLKPNMLFNCCCSAVFFSYWFHNGQKLYGVALSPFNNSNV